MASYDALKAIRFALELKADPNVKLALVELARHKGEMRTCAEIAAGLGLGSGGKGRARTMCIALVRLGFVTRDKPSDAFAIMKDHPALRGIATPKPKAVAKAAPKADAKPAAKEATDAK